MTHLLVLFHTLDHQEEHKTELSNILEFDDNSDNEDCSVCDVYLNADFTELQTTSYFFVSPQFISDLILQQNNQFKPVVLYFKQSRSPPQFLA